MDAGERRWRGESARWGFTLHAAALNGEGLLSSTQLRREIAARNVARGERFAHEVSYSETPSVIYGELEGAHGNFLDAAYARIVTHPEWKQRLRKSYTASRFVPRAADRTRYELECATSSDALLMNIFCYPGVLRRAGVCALLGIERGLQPEFGFRPRVALGDGKVDRTEIDMKLGGLLVEAKLTEGDFQRAPMQRLERYRGWAEVLDVERLVVRDGVMQSWQLIRCVLAARACGLRFAVLCDGRRPDLADRWFEVMNAVREAETRTWLGMVTWQELARTLPQRLQAFLDEKYGIAG